MDRVGIVVTQKWWQGLWRKSELLTYTDRRWEIDRLLADLQDKYSLPWPRRLFWLRPVRFLSGWVGRLKVSGT